MKVTYNVDFQRRSKYWQEHEVISNIVQEKFENAKIEYSTHQKARCALNSLTHYLHREKINNLYISKERCNIHYSLLMQIAGIKPVSCQPATWNATVKGLKSHRSK